jgi:hypothetical protein
MSDPDFISMTIDGKTARVPRSNLDEVMKRLDAAGIPFDAPVGPAPSGAPAAAGPPPQAPREQSPIEWLATMGRRGAEGLYDGAVGLGQGLSMGGADELMGMMPGTSVDGQRAIRDLAMRRSPTAYNLGQAAGSFVPAMLTGGASVPEQVGAAGLQGMAQGALSSDGSMTDRANAAVLGGAVGGGTAGLIGGIGAGVRSLADPLGRAADAERIASLSTGKDFEQLAREHGIDYTMTDLARQAERMGLTNKYTPQGARDFMERAGAARQVAGAAEGSAMDAASAEGVLGDRGNIVQSLDRLRADAATLPTHKRTALPQEYQDIIDFQGMRNRVGDGANDMTPRDIHTLKKQYESEGGYIPDEIRDLPQGIRREAYRGAASAPRDELARVMETASPDVREQFFQNKEEFGYAAALENLARDKVIANSKPLSTGATAGLVSGGSLGGSALGGIPGALAGGAAAYGMGKLARNYGPSMAASALRGMEGGAMTEGGSLAQSGMAAGDVGASAVNWLGSRSDRSSQARQVMDEGKGQNLEAVVKQLLQTNPQQLGQYAPQLQEAMQSEDPMRLTGAIGALWNDPQFRQSIGMQLMQQTGKMR